MNPKNEPFPGHVLDDQSLGTEHDGVGPVATGNMKAKLCADRRPGR